MIPPLSLSGVLPPYQGSNPALVAARAPYLTTTVEIVSRFGSSPERLSIIEGLMRYRQALADLGLTEGFQWVDGSFVEDCEKRRGRPPGDIDIVTFLRRPSTLQNPDDWHAFVHTNITTFRGLITPASKDEFHCDAYFVELDTQPDSLVAVTHYWYGLFSHCRDTSEWKGLLQIPLNDPASDAQACDMLAGR